MKFQIGVTTLLVFSFFFLSTAQEKKIVRPSNTIKIEEGDSNECIVEKATRVIPTKNQIEALRHEFTAFIHFGPNTFTRVEWGSGKEDPKVFALEELDTDQWCAAMKSAGMKMVILTVKHHDGFVLWQSRYTDHGIMSTTFREGKGDVLKDLSASCKKYDLKLGVYLSPADLYQIEHTKGVYGNLSPYTKRTIPKAVPGRPFSNNTSFEFEVDDYNEYFLNQLFELLTEYGPIHEVWFDGAHPKRKGNQQYNYVAWKKLIRTLAPKAVIFGKEDIRWCGNESGATRDTEWNVIPYQSNPDTMSIFPDLTQRDLGAREQLYGAKYLHYQPAETNTSIREGWFYRDDTRQRVRSADDVFDIYERSVGGNSIFLLNIPPNREGLFSSTDVNVLQEVGTRIAETYGTDLLHKAMGYRQVLDGKPNTYKFFDKETGEIVLTTPRPITVNRIVVQESVSTHGERAEKHAIDVWRDGRWEEVAVSTNIGYKRILRFPEVTTTKIRLRILESRMPPAVSHVSAHYYRIRPPQLAVAQGIDGRVSISAKKHQFGWKPHHQDATKNLNMGYEIYYTLDGSDPGIHSQRYTQPFYAEQKLVKAVTVYKGEQGTTETEQVGITKINWREKEYSGSIGKNGVASAFDGDPDTFWQSKTETTGNQLTLDLGTTYHLRGFVYTPRRGYDGGLMAKGRVEFSKDGKIWEKLEDFEFGNLINDPSKRSHYFGRSVETRFVRIVATQIAGKEQGLVISEIDFL